MLIDYESFESHDNSALCDTKFWYRLRSLSGFIDNNLGWDLEDLICVREGNDAVVRFFRSDCDDFLAVTIGHFDRVREAKGVLGNGGVNYCLHNFGPTTVKDGPPLLILCEDQERKVLILGEDIIFSYFSDVSVRCFEDLRSIKKVLI